MIDYNTFLQSAAAISSAIAAIFASIVAKKAYDFQRNAALKHATANQIVIALQHLHYLKSLSDQFALAVDDRTISDLPQKISSLQDCVVALQSMVTTTKAQAEIALVRQLVVGLTENSLFASGQSAQDHECSKVLHNAIDRLQNIYRIEIK